MVEQASSDSRIAENRVPSEAEPSSDMRRSLASQGVDLIAAERRRQVEVEGWTPEHDAEHDKQELLDAALCYAVLAASMGGGTSASEPPWPWDESWWKPAMDGFPSWEQARIRNLVKAGALIAAEIDRLSHDGDQA